MPFFSDLCLENRSETSTESCKAGDAFVVALLNVFSCMASVPQALTLVLEPYLEQAQLWEHLHTLAGTAASYRHPRQEFSSLCLVVVLLG